MSSDAFPTMSASEMSASESSQEKTVSIDSLTDDASADANPPMDPQVRFKSRDGRLMLLLPKAEETSDSAWEWTELYQQLKLRLVAGERFWQSNTCVDLLARNRLLDGRQLQLIADALAEADLKLERVHSSRRQTAVAAATAGYSVEQQANVERWAAAAPGQALVDPLYLQMTVRSGVEIRHGGTVIILGDVNPGSMLVADGDILVWGRLRGMAHAGAGGNRTGRIMALYMQPTQLRIADLVARPPENPPAAYVPEVAYVRDGAIRIAIAADFARNQLPTTLNTAQKSRKDAG